MHARIPRRNDPWSGRRAGDRCVVRGSAVTPKAGRGSERAPGPGGCRAHGRPSGQSLDTGQLPARSAPQLGLSPLALCPTSQGDGPRNCTPLAGPPAALRPTRQVGTERPGAPTRGPRHGRCSQAPERGANTLPANVLRPRHSVQGVVAVVLTVAVTLSQSVTKARNPSPNKVPAVLQGKR